MRLQSPLYEGDSIIRSVEMRSHADSEAGIVQSGNELPHSAASGWPAAKLGNWLLQLIVAADDRLAAFFERSRQRRLERYLGASQNEADLERRLREVERSGRFGYM